MDAVINIALPIFAIIAAGVIAARLGIFSANDQRVLNSFVFKAAMPAALFGLTAGANAPTVTDARLGLAFLIGSFCSMALVYTSMQKFFRASSGDASGHALASGLGNAIFIGIPIALSVDGWIRPFSVLILAEGIFVIGFGSLLIAHATGGKADPFAVVASTLKNPLIAALLLGVFWSLTGMPFEGPAERFFQFFGRAAGPTALFAIGLFFATHQFPNLRDIAGRVSLIVFAKMFVLPFIALSTAYLLGIRDPDEIGALALFVCVPSAVGAFIIASQHNAGQTEVAATALASTFVSLVTISVVLTLFTG